VRRPPLENWQVWHPPLLNTEKFLYGWILSAPVIYAVIRFEFNIVLT
jgi:hypothetical protein